VSRPAWNEDPPGYGPRLTANVTSLNARLAAQAPLRRVPSLADPQQWHRDIYDAVPVPVAYYLGEWRDSDPACPHLVDYEVQVGPMRGVRAAEVPGELAVFEQRMQNATALLDAVIPPRTPPSTTGVLGEVVRLCAFAHGEWVRIHPFANGGGRTARTWVNWIGLRYRLPSFVAIKPRPAGIAYQAAAMKSMANDHRETEQLFEQLLKAAAGAASS
jgi:fido (protein-threonine AMPylation protein)